MGNLLLQCEKLIFKNYKYVWAKPGTWTIWDQPASCVTVALAPHSLLYSTTLRTGAPVVNEVMGVNRDHRQCCLLGKRDMLLFYTKGYPLEVSLTVLENQGIQERQVEAFWIMSLHWALLAAKHKDAPASPIVLGAKHGYTWGPRQF